MPAAQLASAAVEAVINRLLALDADSASRLIPLSGKRLKVTLAELPWPLIFHFSDRIDIVIPAVDVDEMSDCSLSLSLATLQALQDNNQITRLIQQGKLELEGDIQVAQGFSQLISQLDIDWEEQLSHYTGDVVAHNMFSIASQFKQHVSGKIAGLAKTLSEGAIEEKHIAAPGLLVTDFCDQVTRLRSDTDRLEARLANLEETKFKASVVDKDHD
ncbi:ubiquinone biosynthesis accessory factor UbiJ [Aliiglaciecola litoralis]|uniref:Ubiquinone biosynthesis accessory factor UbiJ n=1 Tax=Aliiglaciecola litoralis TaxID=582857 RepID=A0ABP3WQC5_9ALTE